MQLRSRLALAFIGAVAIFTIIGCSGNKPEPKPKGKFWQFFSQPVGITVVGEDLQPLPGAKILIGSELDQPFAGNYLVADAAGHIDIPAGWTTAVPVTMEAADHIRATYFEQLPGDRTYRLRKKKDNTQYELTGVTSGHTIVDRDGYLNFSLVVPALTRNDFLSFDLNSVISPQLDILSVMGQEAAVPSNVAFPKQKESYFIPVTIEKPAYRVYLPGGGMQRVFAAQGRFPFKKVVDKIRSNTPFFEVVNDFSVSGGGVKDLNLTKPSTSVNLSVTGLDFKNKIDVTAPAVGGDETLMVVGVAHMAEYMIPTDVKVLKSAQKVGLSILDNSASVFSILKKTKDMESTAPGADRMSAVLIPGGGGAAPELLPIMADPTLASNGDLLLSKMNSIAGVNPVATYGVISVVEQARQGNQKVRVNNQYWEMYAPQWLEVVALPQWPEGNHLPGLKKWEINLIGSLNVSQVDLGPAMINNATHVTHSSLDF